jgi:predicted transposase/invertase (TIGR01784 family)
VLISENQNYHNRYRLHDSETGSEFTDLLEVHTLEIPKLPQNADGTVLWQWLKFLGAKKQEELTMLAEKNPDVKKAVGRLMELSADEQTRLLAESREKLHWDIESMKEDAEETGMAKGMARGMEKGRNEERLSIARKALAQNMPLESIVMLTGLSLEEIRTLH